ncbi:hypothetical protein CAAN1_16S03334 [[Candida] anglica]|uniref:RRM domain-containing protein n=1 Tax=[Candida] anglica TaxID=148631 RepID=A0ABP0EA09_9ASCO
MDLRNLSSTPNQLDSMQRRPSLSSLSSTSGYASSTYGNTTPQLSNQRINQARNFAGLTTNSSSTNLQGSWFNAGTPPGGSTVQTQVVNNVAPWVEQQQAQQQAGVGALGKPEKSGSKRSSSNGPGGRVNNNGNHNNNTNIEQSSMVNGSSNDNEGINRHEEDEEDEDVDGEDRELDDDDELIPTAIVIKNIPFAIKKEQLLDVMTKLNLPLPYAFNYHFDNGVFRGLAFANFTSTNETSSVVNLLNGREIGGRKLRVEYKKMLPLQERERIEREKREKRGQLEEQHRSTSNASLASLMSTASTTAATKNLSVSGSGTQNTSQTERLFVAFPSQVQSASPLPLIPAEVNFNDPDVLDLYTQLVLYRDDSTKSVFELAFPSTLTIGQRKILSILASFLNLLELYDNGIIIIRRKPGQAPLARSTLVISPHPPSHSSSMMNLNQLNTNGGATPVPTAGSGQPELLRSHSQSAIPISTRPMTQSSTPIQSQFPQYQQSSTANQSISSTGGGNSGRSMYAPQATTSSYYQPPPPPPQQQQQQPNQQQGGTTQHGQSYQQGPPPPSVAQGSSQTNTPAMGSSAAALLRSSNNRSYVDVRATPPLQNSFIHHGTESPTPQHHHFFSNGIQLQSGQVSQPGTPLTGSDINSRFAPFGQHSNLTGSYTSLSTTQPQGQNQSGGQPTPQPSTQPPSQPQQQQQQQPQPSHQHHHQHHSHQQPPTQQAPHYVSSEDYQEGIQQKFGGLNLGNTYDAANTSGSGSNNGIWGPK